MIVVTLPAVVNCDEPGCETHGPAMVTMLATKGGFAHRLRAEGWQMIELNGSPTLTTKCPEHALKIQVGHAGPRIVRADGH